MQNSCNPRRAHLSSVLLEHPYLQQPATRDIPISMSSSSSSLSKWETQFVGEPISELPDDHLPTLGEIFRFLHHHRQSSRPTESHRNHAQLCSVKCIEIWKKFGIPTALEHNVTRKLVNLLKLFKAVHCKSGKARKRNEILWGRKLQLVFSIAARNAMKKCRGKKRQMLQTLEKEAKELEDFERSVRVKKTFDDSEMSPIVNEAVKEQESLKKKAESAENAEHAMKRCKVMLLRMGATTVLDEHTKKQPADVVPAAMDVQPEEEDIVPPNLPSVIIKEEIVIDWDENANLYNSLEDLEKYYACR